MCRWHLLNSGVYAADFCRIAACLPLAFVEYSGVRAADVCRMATQSAQILSLSYNLAQGSRVGPSRDLSREELDGLREEARLAKQSNFPGRERGPFVKPGEKPGFWPGQACCEGHMGGRRRFRNRGGK